ncbi:phosphotransferase family protein [Rhodovulum strictum]|uniref:Aminoglycoside phosphotransferase domain-containing protein n=1 Tax=Rhodovulum strictum TaxID=58314 RepID=A0A844BAP1_9RHOB|nr:phosphotransferase [Rhodovulum strictum]MRH21494.1 hypothetical protein [Rhodovulum strictum]
MARDLGELEHLLDAAETLCEIQARRPAVAQFHSETALFADGRTAIFRGRYNGASAMLTLFQGEGHVDRARRRKRDLEQLGAALANERFRIAPLVAAWPGEGLTLTADVAGERLDTALALATPAERDALIAEAGAWLARIVAEAHRQAVFGGRHWVRNADRALARTSGREDRALARDLATRLEALLPTVAGKPVTQAHCHGDFRPAHLVHSGDVLCGVAMQGAHWQPVVRDLARFVVDLHLTHPRPGGQRRFGVDADDIAALTAPLTQLERPELALHLPFFIGIELAEWMGRADLSPDRAALVREAIAHFLEGNGAPLI